MNGKKLYGERGGRRAVLYRYRRRKEKTAFHTYQLVSVPSFCCMVDRGEPNAGNTNRSRPPKNHTSSTTKLAAHSVQKIKHHRPSPSLNTPRPPCTVAELELDSLNSTSVKDGTTIVATESFGGSLNDVAAVRSRNTDQR
jgi:hypothetical protein